MKLYYRDVLVEQRRDKLPLFKSDFGKVAEFFVKSRKYGKDKITEHMSLKDIHHVEEVINLLSVFTKIPRERFVYDGRGGIEVTSALLGLQEHWTKVGAQQEKAKNLSERKEMLKKFLNAKVDGDVLRSVFSDDEIREAQNKP